MKYLYFFIAVFLIGCGDSYNEKIMKYNSFIDEAETALELGNYNLVIEKSDEAYNIFDSLSIPLVIKGQALNGKKEYKKAIKVAEKIIEIDGDKSFGYKIKADAYNGLNKKEKAIEAASHYNQYFQNDFSNVNFIATLYFEEEEYEKAIPYLSRLINNDYNEGENLIRRAIAYEKIGEVAMSINDYERLKEEYKEDIDTSNMTYLLGELNLKNKDYNKAIEYLMQSENSNKYKLLGYAYDELNYKDSAVYYFDKYLHYVDKEDSKVLKRKFELEKEFFSSNNLDYNYFKYKKVVWKELPILFKLLVYIIPLICFVLLFNYIYRNNINEVYFDGYTMKGGWKFGLLLFPFGGSFLYLGNRFFTYIISGFYAFVVVFFTKPVYLHYTSIEHLFKVILTNQFAILILAVSGVIIMLDFFSMPFRINSKNISCRRNLNLDLIRKRSSAIKSIAAESKNIKEDLDYFSNEFNTN